MRIELSSITKSIVKQYRKVESWADKNDEENERKADKSSRFDVYNIFQREMLISLKVSSLIASMNPTWQTNSSFVKFWLRILIEQLLFECTSWGVQSMSYICIECCDKVSFIMDV